MKTTVEQALTEVDTWSDEVLVGQLFSVASGGHAAKDILGFGEGGSTDDANQRLKEYIRDYHLGAVIYFPPGGDHEPVADIRRTIEELQEAAEVPLLIATDQENGTVARVRVGATHLPGAMALGATGDPQLWEATARATAEQLRAVGIFQTFAPVADVNVVPANPGVNIRSAGSDPQRAADQLRVVVSTMGKEGLGSTLKHFPGYGSAAADPHFGLPSVGLTRQAWDATERIPFQAAIDAGADAVMLGHVAFPALDSSNAATFSPAIVRDLLRNDMGFSGVIVTDAMDMGGADRPEGPAEACVSALQAGADQILMPVDLPQAYDAVLRAVSEGRLRREQLRDSARRILRLKAKLGLDDPQIEEMAIFDSPEHVEVARAAAAASVAQRDPRLPATLAPGASVLLIHPGEDPQKRGVNPAEVLAPILREAGHPVLVHQWGATESEGGPWPGIGAVLGGQALSSVETSPSEAVVVLRDAWKDDLPVAEVLAELDRAGMAVHVVATRSPYEAAAVDSRHDVLLTYGDNEYAIEAAGNVLIGLQEARGRIPMNITAPSESAEAN